jgi:hypothetical protein
VSPKPLLQPTPTLAEPAELKRRLLKISVRAVALSTLILIIAAAIWIKNLRITILIFKRFELRLKLRLRSFIKNALLTPTDLFRL